jgi:cell pole-organizing protein PopZ
MSEDTAQQEPTMEEILASIRRIISEDNDEEVSAEPTFDAEPEQDEEELTSEDIMELTEMLGEVHEDAVEEEVEEEAPFVEVLTEDLAEDEPEPSAGTAHFEEPVSAEPEVHFSEPVILHKDPEPEVSPMMEEAKSEELLSDMAAGAAAASFDNLARSMPVTEEDGRTLEGIVAEMLRPVLKSWLDENLPTIVEELVQKEIERVTGRGV